MSPNVFTPPIGKAFSMMKLPGGRSALFTQTCEVSIFEDTPMQPYEMADSLSEDGIVFIEATPEIQKQIDEITRVWDDRIRS